MEQYIVRYTGGSSTPTEEKERVKSFPGIQVLDESPKMLLVRASPETAAALDNTLPDWSVSAQREYTIPSPRPRVLHSLDE